MCIVIVVPAMVEHVFEELERECNAYLKLLVKYGTHRVRFSEQKLKFHRLNSYNVERKCDYDIIMTIQDEFNLTKLFNSERLRNVDWESMLDENVTTEGVKAVLSRGDFRPQEPMLRAIAVHLGIAVPPTMNFRKQIALHKRGKIDPSLIARASKESK